MQTTEGFNKKIKQINGGEGKFSLLCSKQKQY